MRTSVTMQAGGRARQASSASAAASNTWTAWPADSSNSSSESRTASSSSTIKTSLFSGGMMLILISQGECEAERDAAFEVRRRVQAPAMRIDDRLADRQAQAHSLCLGGLERLEQLRLDL